MKKNQKNLAINNQQEEHFEVYTLYPENAIADTNHKKQQQMRKDGFALKGKEPHKLMSINQPSSNSKIKS